MVLYHYKSIDEIPGSELFMNELTSTYGSDAPKMLKQSGLKLNIGINDSDYKKTVLEWDYQHNARDKNEVNIFRFSSQAGTAPIKGYVFARGELRCPEEGKITQYFKVTPTKKIGLEIILEK
jgi:hypothetical protein